MDILTLAQINNLKKSGGFGYTETKVLTFDGDFAGKEIVAESLVKISDTFIDVKSVEKVCLYETEVNETVTFTKAMFTYTIADVCMLSFNDLPLVFTTEAGGYWGGLYLSKGTYIVGSEGAYWVTRVEFAETIHPIDPKFLPPMAGGLPVVKLTTEIVIGTPTPFTAEEGAMLDELLLQGMPIIFKSVLDVQGTKMPLTFVADCMDGFGFTMTNGTLLLNIFKNGDRWEAQTG